MLPKPGLAFFATAMRFTQAPAGILPADAVPPGLDALGDYVMWGLIPDPAETDVLRDQGPEELLRRARELTVGASPVLQSLVENSRIADTLFSRFSAGRPGGQRAFAHATAIGDAIHPMPPLGAHGGNTALRSAQALAARLASVPADVPGQIPAAIDAYETEMTEYATAAIRAAESQTACLTRRGIGAFALRRILPLLRRQR
ncbi:FAD-dependent oxidoreductase [Sinomonas sp. P47F7]|uniref:FAD-dependent oxidoreductase n=1 Tax=Sinomonas sp. P47F7 TaxID=3410987 RepID=UPI003BF46E11